MKRFWKIYGWKEHIYCEPVAEELARNLDFAAFFLERAGLAGWRGNFRCLKEEQLERRQPAPWWKNVYCHESACKCPRLAGKEVDICAVFEKEDGARTGLYVECKNPEDKELDVQQAQGYRERLSCWTQAGRGPRTIPRHESATSVLIADNAQRFAPDAVKSFRAVILFSEIEDFILGYSAACSLRIAEGKANQLAEKLAKK